MDLVLLNKQSTLQRERLYHIDFRAWFLGTLGRNDLIERFGIQKAAATRDVSLYKQIAPQNIEYDSVDRIYKTTPSFVPVFEHDARQVLNGLGNGFVGNHVRVSNGFVPCDSPVYLNQPDLNTVAIVSRAIALQRTVKIDYCSLTSGKTTRIIAPLAFVDTGTRWHVRAFDRRRRVFTDFVLTRITQPELLIESPLAEERKEHDKQWNRIVDLELVPHPGLKNAEAIELDYGMQDGTLNVEVRAAIAGYVLHRWSVDCSENATLSSLGHHLWLKNRAALYGVETLGFAPGYKSTEK